MHFLSLDENHLSFGDFRLVQSQIVISGTPATVEVWVWGGVVEMRHVTVAPGRKISSPLPSYNPPWDWSNTPHGSGMQLIGFADST